MSPTSIAPSVISTSMVLLTSILTTTEADSPVPPLPPETLTTTVTRARNNTQAILTDHLTLLEPTRGTLTTQDLGLTHAAHNVRRHPPYHNGNRPANSCVHTR